MMSRHHTEVATELNPVQWIMRSRHQIEVATEDEQLKEPLCRDIWKLSGHHQLKREGQSRKEVATRLSYRNISCIKKKVVTTPSCRDINGEDLRSRHHQAVATTSARKRGRDNIQRS